MDASKSTPEKSEWLNSSADSNARAIEALANHTAEARGIAEQDRSELRVAVNELIQESRENIAQHLSFREEIQQLRDRVDGG